MAGISENLQTQMEKEINREDSTPENLDKRPKNMERLGETRASNMTNNTMKPDKQAKLDYEQMKGKSRLKGDSAINVTGEKLTTVLDVAEESVRVSLLPEHDNYSPSVDFEK